MRMTEDEQLAYEAYESEVIAEIAAETPPDPAHARYERRTFVSRQRGRWNGWRELAGGGWVHVKRSPSARNVRQRRVVDLIYDRQTGAVESVRTFAWDDAASEIYGDAPDSTERLIAALGGEQEIEFEFGRNADKFGRFTGLSFNRR